MAHSYTRRDALLALGIALAFLCALIVFPSQVWFVFEGTKSGVETAFDVLKQLILAPLGRT